MNIRPVNNQVLVEPIEESEKTDAGFVIPEDARGKSVRGRILAIGPGRVMGNGQSWPMDFSVGQVVVYAKFSGADVVDGGKTLVILNEQDILAVKENL